MSERFEPIRQIFEEVDRRDQNNRWIATALVTDARVDDRSIRVAILPELTETNWVRVYYTNAGSNFMSGMMPEVGTEVLCLFLGADPNAVIVLGGAFIQEEAQLPQIDADNALPIYDPYGNSIVMSSGGITITDNNGNIIQTTSGGITVTCTKDLTVNSSGKTNITSTGDITINSSGKANITSSADTTITSSTGNVKVTALNTSLEATVKCSVKAPLLVLNDGTMPVARLGDPVTTPIGPGTVTLGNPTVLA